MGCDVSTVGGALVLRFRPSVLKIPRHHCISSIRSTEYLGGNQGRYQFLYLLRIIDNLLVWLIAGSSSGTETVLTSDPEHFQEEAR